MNRIVLIIVTVVAAAGVPLLSQSSSGNAAQQASEEGASPPASADLLSGLKARSIGPAVTSGRVMTIAVDPSNQAVVYIGAASGGIWKTVNGGASWQPIFD